jgi:alpha-galactosidase
MRTSANLYRKKSMPSRIPLRSHTRASLLAAVAVIAFATAPAARAQTLLTNDHVALSINTADGSYAIGLRDATAAVMHAYIGARVDGRWLTSRAYRRHSISPVSEFSDEFGSGQQVQMINTGLHAEPDLIATFQVYRRGTQPNGAPFATIEVSLRNRTARSFRVQALRLAEAFGTPLLNVPGGLARARVLSDSFSEDRPEMAIYDFGAAPNGMHRAVGSQLVYNRDTSEDLFWGVLTARRWLTIFHLQAAGSAPPSGSDAASPASNVAPAAANAAAASYTVDCTGTTEIEKEQSLRSAPRSQQIALSLPLPSGGTLASERVAFTGGADYLHQLQAYGDAIRILDRARVTTPPMLGWWSWTAFYGGLNQGTALTNARWLAEHLRSFGYRWFHIDEGYQYARGEYTSTNAHLFPNGMRPVEWRINHLGLWPGIWTAPFEVAGNAWVARHRLEWLVHDAAGHPIQINWVGDEPAAREPLYALDTTHPGAQQYLRTTYETISKLWGVRYIKLDFMDDTAIEGYRYRPNTTALEAQRLGLEIIRRAVGDDVVLDKDGSPMLTPVGVVDAGRISLDTGHSFTATQEAAAGIAARFYMNRNFFLDDPDAFTVAPELLPDQTWHQDRQPLPLSAAQASIALAAVSGSMFEIGDDLPTLGADPARVALVENPDLLTMAKLGRASLPLDLMSYIPADRQPSVFLLREDARQAILTVFNFTAAPRSHAFRLSDLGFPSGDRIEAGDVMRKDREIPTAGGSLALDNAPQSVRVVRLVDLSVAAQSPSLELKLQPAANTGDEVEFAATVAPNSVPVLGYRWDFGDGTHADGASVRHAYTHAGTMSVTVTADGVDGIPAEKAAAIRITGVIPTRLDPKQNVRRPPAVTAAGPPAH